MIRLICTTLVLLNFLFAGIRAQETTAKSGPGAIDLETIENPPNRQIRFEYTEEPFGPGQLEPVIAIIRLGENIQDSETVSGSELVSSTSRGLEKVDDLRQKRLDAGIVQQAFLRVSLFDDQGGPTSLVRKPFSDYFRTVMKAIPDKAQPESLVRDFFISENVDKGFLQVSSMGNRGTGGTEIKIMARDKAGAETLVAGLLHMLDWGVSRPIQLSLWEEREAWDHEIARLQMEQEKASKLLAETRTKLEEAKDLSSESLTDLRTQQRLLQVDIAGVKARVKACDQQLDKKLSGHFMEHILNLKITAEIDLAGLIAKKSVLDELVSATGDKKKLEMTLRENQIHSSQLGTQLNAAKRERTRIENSVKKFAPLPLVDGKVTIITRT